MNRYVHVLLTFAFLVSVLSVAQAETMEERKQRIMRKYMRERQDIVQSDLGVPDNALAQEDDRVAESEQFKEPSLEFERQEGGAAPLPIARPMPAQTERNWWLETAEMEENPYADPFSSKSDNEEAVKSRWSPWGNRDESSVYDSTYGRQQEQPTDTYSGSRNDSFIYGDAGSRQWDWRRDDTYPGMTYDGYTTRRTPTYGESGRMPGIYGRQPTDYRRNDTGWILDSGGRYRPSQSTGLLQPSMPLPTDTQSWSSQSPATGYTPYRSPYQIQVDQQRRSGGNLQPQQTPYMRQNNYQKWKDNNKTWDPSAGNSYLDELMRDQRR